MPGNGTIARPALLEIIRKGAFEKKEQIAPGVEVLFKMLTKKELDDSNLASARRVSDAGVSSADPFARTAILQEEQLARAILAWNGIQATYEENVVLLQQTQATLFNAIWSKFQALQMFQEFDILKVREEVKNSSGSQSPEPSGDSSGASQMETGSTESVSVPTSSPS